MHGNFTNLKLIYKNFIKRVEHPIKKKHSIAKFALLSAIGYPFSIILSSQTAFAAPAIDWSTTMPEEYHEEQTKPSSNSSRKNETQQPITEDAFPADSNLTSSPQKPQLEGAEINSFDAEWNSTHSIDPKEYDSLNHATTRGQELRGRQYEPIWRPFYSQITLEDFDYTECCVRVIRSSSLEVEEKCEMSGNVVWQVGNVPFTPEEPVIQHKRSCYLLEKTAVGNAWKYRCTAKSMAKCYNPRLPQNFEFIELFEADEAIRAALQAELKGLASYKKEKIPHPSLDDLLNLLPKRPEKEPPKDLKLPILNSVTP